MKSSFASCNTLMHISPSQRQETKTNTEQKLRLCARNGLNCLRQNYFRNYHWLIGSILKKKSLNQVLIPSDSLLGVHIFCSWTPTRVVILVFKLKIHGSHHRVFTVKATTVKMFQKKLLVLQHRGLKLKKTSMFHCLRGIKPRAWNEYSK